MIDIVIPEQNEREFIAMAEKLGYDSLCFYYRQLKPAYLKHLETLAAGTRLKLCTAAPQAKKTRPDIVIVKTTDPRQWIESRKADIVYGMEQSRERDTIKQKKSGLNQVLCSLARKKGRMIGLDFASIAKAEGQKRVVLLGRMIQNIWLCRKYKAETCIASFAHDPMDMRNPKDIMALFQMLGMEAGDAKESLERAGRRIREQRKPGQS